MMVSSCARCQDTTVCHGVRQRTVQARYCRATTCLGNMRSDHSCMCRLTESCIPAHALCVMGHASVVRIKCGRRACFQPEALVARLRATWRHWTFQRRVETKGTIWPKDLGPPTRGPDAKRRSLGPKCGVSTSHMGVRDPPMGASLHSQGSELHPLGSGPVGVAPERFPFRDT